MLMLTSCDTAVTANIPADLLPKLCRHNTRPRGFEIRGNRTLGLADTG